MSLKKVLLTQYYISSNEERQNELDQVLLRNCWQPLISKIALYCEDSCKQQAAALAGTNIDKIIFVSLPASGRLTFGMAFQWANENLTEGEVLMIANSDIFFDDSLNVVDKYLPESAKTSLLLSRWNVKSEIECHLFPVPGSQDTWMFRMPLQLAESTLECSKEIPLGIAGCDNRIAHEICVASGYVGVNCCTQVRTFHLHKSNFRTYDPSKPIPGPYFYIQIT